MDYKKWLCLVMVVIGLMFTVSCKEQANDTSSIDIPVESCEFDIDALRDESHFEGEILKDKIIAKRYSDSIIETVLNKSLDEYKLICIGLNENAGIWVMDYGPADKETIGDSISIALSKKSGEVLYIWFGE